MVNDISDPDKISFVFATINRNEGAAKQLIAITILLQGFYLVVMILGQFKYLHSIYFIFYLFPSIMWLFSLIFAMNVIVTFWLPKEIVTDKEIHETDKKFIELKYNSLFLRNSYKSLFIGLIPLIFVLFASIAVQTPTDVSFNQHVSLPMELPSHSLLENNGENADNSNVNANIFIPSVVIQRYYTSENFIEPNNSNATYMDAITTPSVGSLSIVAIIIGIAIGLIFAVWL
jgi:hypothetical protein